MSLNQDSPITKPHLLFATFFQHLQVKLLFVWVTITAIQTVLIKKLMSIYICRINNCFWNSVCLNEQFQLQFNDGFMKIWRKWSARHVNSGAHLRSSLILSYEYVIDGTLKTVPLIMFPTLAEIWWNQSYI